METHYTRHLLKALKALLAADTHYSDGLLALLPPKMDVSAYKPEDFSGDMLCLFNECLIDMGELFSEPLYAENPRAAELVERHLFDVLDMYVPYLYQDEPEQWTDFRRQLADLVGKLEDVV